jgi:hypothetical protein
MKACRHLLRFLAVTKAPYLADPTGKQDATTAIRQALNDARDARRITCLPAGRYLGSYTIEGVRGTVRWDRWPSAMSSSSSPRWAKNAEPARARFP